MSKILRQSIVPIAAVAGAQLINLVVSPAQPGQSSSCLQWASEAVNDTSARLQRTFNPPYVPEGMSEGEYNQLREVFHTDDIRLSQPQPTAAQPGATAPTATAPQARAVDAAFLPNGLTVDEYQARRRAMRGGY
jgi:hypothetical protein